MNDNDMMMERHHIYETIMNIEKKMNTQVYHASCRASYYMMRA